MEQNDSAAAGLAISAGKVRVVEAMMVSVEGSVVVRAATAWFFGGAGRRRPALRVILSVPGGPVALGRPSATACGRVHITAPPSASRARGEVAQLPRNIPPNIPPNFPSDLKNFGDVGDVGDVFCPLPLYVRAYTCAHARGQGKHARHPQRLIPDSLQPAPVDADPDLGRDVPSEILRRWWTGTGGPAENGFRRTIRSGSGTAALPPAVVSDCPDPDEQAFTDAKRVQSRRRSEAYQPAEIGRVKVQAPAYAEVDVVTKGKFQRGEA